MCVCGCVCVSKERVKVDGICAYLLVLYVDLSLVLRI